MDRLLETTFGKSSHWFETHWVPPLDLYESKDKLILLLELPAVEKKEIEVTLQEDILTITGIRRSLLPQGEHICHRMEIQQGRFLRKIKLSRPVKGDKISARLKNGILKIEIPKEN